MTNVQSLQTKIESLSHDGRGVAHIDGKATFIENALPGEEITFIYTRRHNKFDEAKTVEILSASADRVKPECPHFGVCGGCGLQHIDHIKQIEFKINNLKEHFKHFGDIENLNILPPILGPVWYYRSRARLSIKYVQKKQKVLVGFHEKNGRYIAEIDQCPILHETISNKILDIGNLVSSLTIYQQIPQVEVACGDNITALLFRHLAPLSEQDLELLAKFGCEHNFQIYLQSGSIDTIKPLLLPISTLDCFAKSTCNDEAIQTEQVNDKATQTGREVITREYIPLNYKFSNHNIEMLFALTDFTQINKAVNQKMVDLVVDLLDIKPEDRILDLFCGIGNFTLPIAKKCQQIVGVEGNNHAIIRAKQNAKHNNITNTEFYCADLTKDLASESWAGQKYDKILLDPPRTGAQEICSQIKKFGAKKIVYVSCNHATLARDTKDLIQSGYKLQNVRVVNMFPHTAHIETIAVFSRPEINNE